MVMPWKQQLQPLSLPQGALLMQHVGKASSDELLHKFADPNACHLATTPPRRSLTLRRKRSSQRLAAPKRRRSIGGSADWRTGLLLPTTTAASVQKGQARREGAARLDNAAGFGLILAALERKWRKTVSSSASI
uniref:Uncharacterized protein n=1 Tax=Setaria viridis TaxID=4556 RepID=A0A4U6TSM9_SETVI|nr:hypothetical protein SEVIR_7G062400v2 [Setaria viridis]